MNIQLLIIDPQNDFCNKNGNLFVPGADADMGRLAGFVSRLKGKLDDIHVTLDSHQEVDIAHPMWWKDSTGKHPAPFTLIQADDVRNGRWTTTQPGAYKRSLAYLDALASGGRYPHVIWPYHCIIGSEGHSVDPSLRSAIHEWATDRFATVDYVTKGSNPWTEHFSGVKAEVPDPQDPTTQVNTSLISTLERADVVLLAGEALSHCMANTVRDIAAEFDPASVRKLVLLTDATSNVSGFEKLGNDFVSDLTAKGMQVSTTKDFLATV